MSAKLYKSETWFPQRSKTIAPRQILNVLSNIVRCRTAEDGRTLPLLRSCTPEAFREWIKKWDCRI